MKKGVIHVWSAIMTAILFSASSSADQPIERPVTGGIVRGIILADGSAHFRGIPYASPPTGEMRWKAPEPVAPWTGVRDATKPGPACKQRSYQWNAADAASGSEDCLYLDVRVPAHPAGERLPVMVWIHGGANRAGSGSGYSTSAIVQHGVILVTMQYRLGIFGFLSHPALTAESPYHASGNYALMDQIAVLKWVQANIAVFDGDPGNVTIFGQSAGAQDVGLLMVSPLARGLFHKAIEQSGTSNFGFAARTLQQNERLGLDLSHTLHFSDDAYGLKGLRQASADVLLEAADHLVPPIEDDGFIWDQPTVDGYVLPTPPETVYAAKKQAAVPLIIGNNARELPLFGGPNNVKHTIIARFGKHAQTAMKLYGVDGDIYPSDDPVLGSLSTRLANDLMFRCPAEYVAASQSGLLRNVWRYQFDVAQYGSSDPVWHSSELSYVFEQRPNRLDFGQWPPIQIYWSNFARTGDPNGDGLPYWPIYATNRYYLEFLKSGPSVGQSMQTEICKYLSHP